MWAARDKDGSLVVYNDDKPPYRVNDKEWEGHNFIYIDDKLFPNLKWENEPIEVSIIPNEALNGLYKIIDQYKSIPQGFTKVVDDNFWDLI